MSALDLKSRRKPRFKLPPGTCDAHCHVFGPGDKFPYAPNRRYTPDDAPKEMLAALHAHLGIDRAVIVQASCHGTDNRAMLDCIASDPKRYRGVAIVDDSFTDADYDRLHAGGVRGVRFNFVKHLGGAPDMAVFNRVIDRIKGRGWHVVLHLDAPDIVPLSDMIRKLPLPFVIDHMGRVPSAAGVDQPPLARADRAFAAMKTAGSRYAAPSAFPCRLMRRRCRLRALWWQAAPARVLWGTDFPHPNPTHEADEADLVDLVPQYAPEALAQKRLLVDNPARLYGFDQ